MLVAETEAWRPASDISEHEGQTSDRNLWPKTQGTSPNCVVQTPPKLEATCDRNLVLFLHTSVCMQRCHWVSYQGQLEAITHFSPFSLSLNPEPLLSSQINKTLLALGCSFCSGQPLFWLDLGPPGLPTTQMCVCLLILAVVLWVEVVDWNYLREFQ